MMFSQPSTENRKGRGLEPHRTTRFAAMLMAIGLVALLAGCQLNSPLSDTEPAEEAIVAVEALLELEASNPQLAYVEGEVVEPQNIGDGAHAVAWLWAHAATSAIGVPYTAPLDYNYHNRVDENPLDGRLNNYPSARNTVVRLADGIYMVAMPRFNFYGGVVHVTSQTNNHCKVSSWVPVGTELRVFVRCFNSGGSLANSSFTLLFYRNAKFLSDHGLSYVWSHNMSAESYVPHFSAYYGSRGGGFVRREGTGRYKVFFGGMTRASGEQNKGGHIQVTAYGFDSTHCKVAQWDEGGHIVVADINCFNSSGALTDSRFTASFMREPGTIAIRNSSGKRRAHYLLADQLNSSVGVWYTPNTFYQAYQSASSAVSRVRRDGTGAYTVYLPNLKVSNLSNVQVTAYGAGATRCTVNNWGGSNTSGHEHTYVYVRCYNSSGNLANASFVLHYITQ